MLPRIAVWAGWLRARFDSFAARIDPFGVVTVLLVATAAVAGLMARTTPDRCARLPVRIIDLELTFSARRFASLLQLLSGRGCTDHFLASLVTWDVVFPVTYALTLCALFIWAERQRRFSVNGSETGDRIPGRNHVFVVLPLLAGATDILLENLPLRISGQIIAGNPDSAHSAIVSILVLIGSLGASLKWSLVFISILAFLAEMLNGARGIIIRRLRYGLLAVLLGALPLLAIPQGQDILQRTVEGDTPWPGVVRALIAILFGAFVVWYCGRKLVQLRFPRDPAMARDWYEFHGEHIPRILGITVIVLAAAAFARAGAAFPLFAAVAFLGFVVASTVNKLRPSWTVAIGRIFVHGYLRLVPKYDQDVGRTFIAVVVALGMFLKMPDAIDFRLLRVLAYLLLVSSWLFYLYVYKRRGRIAARRATQTAAKMAAASTAEPSTESNGFNVNFSRYSVMRVEGDAVSSIDPQALNSAIKATIAIGLFLSLAALAVFIWWPVTVARFVGTLIVLSMAVASVVFYGSIATWVHERHGIPIAPIALALAALFSIWNDSHLVRRLTGDQSRVRSRSDIPTRLDLWNADTAGRGNSQMILVAAAGGGLRAAYWTAVTLGVLQDSIPGFNRHVFAISSVSGGSVGASVYAALVRDSVASQGRMGCLVREHSFAGCVREFMREDYLSPVLAKMLAPDLVQSFLPFPWTQLDRSLALEGSWEDSYRHITGANTMGEGFLSLYGGTSPSLVPALFLNTTHVESGKRYIISPVTRGDSSPPPGGTPGNMHDSQDLIALLGSDLRLSTAAHNSARFSYVSPPGRIQRGDTLEFGHVVDGGYFENSGLATLREVIEAVRERDPGANPIVLYLCNDPLPCNVRTKPGNVPTVPRATVVEWFGPVRALLSTRDARGSLSRADIADVPYARFIQLNVCDALIAADTIDSGASTLGGRDREKRARERVISPPLGWLLSKVARDWMDSSLTRGASALRPSRCRMDNAQAVAYLSALLKH